MLEKKENKTLFNNQVLAEITHDLKTNVAAVENILNVLKDTSLNPDQKFYLKILESGNYSIKSLIENLMQTIRSDLNQLELNYRLFDLQETIVNTCDIWRFQAESKNLKLFTHFYNLPQQVKADETKIVQILTNLISNGIKFTKSGHIRVSAIGSQQNINEHNKAIVDFIIEDTGIGISKRDLDHIFDAYMTNDIKNGIGLGLNITRKMVNLMGGKIRASSNGKGTIFKFNLILDLPS
jgi:signal transduction histidine kinase